MSYEEEEVASPVFVVNRDMLPPPVTDLSVSGKQFGEIIAFLSVTAAAVAAAIAAAGRKIVKENIFHISKRH